jgi:hypothetical protein
VAGLDVLDEPGDLPARDRVASRHHRAAHLGLARRLREVSVG